MSFNYKQAFWAVIFDISDIGEANRQRLAAAAAALQKTAGVLIALSAGGRTAQEAPELSLVLDINADIVALLPDVKTALSNAGLGDNKVELLPEIRFHNFTALQLGHIAQSVAVPVSDEAYAPETGAVPTTVESATGAITHADLSFSVIASRQKSLTDDKGDLWAEFDSLRRAFRELANEAKSCAAVVVMAREGLVTIGMKMWNQFINSPQSGSIITAIEPLIGAIGGMVEFRTLVTTIATPLAVLQPNVASNMIIFLNEQSADLTLTDSKILDGSSGVVVDSIGATRQPTKLSPIIYSCGLHLSYRSEPLPLTPTPTALQSGLALALARKDPSPCAFSLGVHAPNSTDGDLNAVRVRAGDAADTVLGEVVQSNNATDEVSVGTAQVFVVRGRRASAYGEWNYVLGRISA